MKYKPCCNIVCLLGNCETRSQGGCYCVCRLKDAEGIRLAVLEGKASRAGSGFVYVPGKSSLPSEEEITKTNEELQIIRDKLKKYEVQEPDAEKNS